MSGIDSAWDEVKGVDKYSDLACSVQLLLDRLSDFEPDNINDENARDWYGHVVPAIERLKQSLGAIK